MTASGTDAGTKGALILRIGWQGIIAKTLDAWHRNPSELEDDDIRPPSSDTIALARQLAQRLCDRGSHPPTRIVPNGSGGITFERHDGTSIETFRIHADQSVELVAFDDCRIVNRHPIDVDQI